MDDRWAFLSRAGRCCLVGSLAVVTCLWPGALMAQTPGDTGGFRQSPGDDRPSLPPLREPSPPAFDLPPVSPVPEREKRLSSGIQVTLNGVRFEGNTVFASTVLASEVADYIGRPIDTEELLEVRDLVTNYYIERGYINSGAVIPDQDVQDGVLQINLIEGRLTSVDIQGLDALRPTFIEDRIALSVGPPLDINKLRERIQLLIADGAIDRINARLVPEGEPGKSRLELDVAETARYKPTFQVANDRSPSTGGERVEMGLEVGNFLGLSDPLAFQLGLTRGARDFGIDYSVPLTPHDLRLNLAGKLSSSKVVEEPFNELDVESESQQLAIGLSRSFFKSVDREVLLEATFERKRSVTLLLGRRFSFSEGVQDGKSVVTAFRFAQQWQSRGQEQVVVLRQTENIGVDLFGATVNDGDIPDGQFFSWVAQAQYLRRLFGSDWQLKMRGDIQLTPDRLLPIERIAIGGSDTVRGYRENQLVTDNGWIVSGELQIPLGRWQIPGIWQDARDGALQLALFTDAGGGWNIDGGTPKDNKLLSIGSGFRWQLNENVEVSLDLGLPLLDVPEPADDDDLQDFGIHFALNARLY